RPPGDDHRRVGTGDRVKNGPTLEGSAESIPRVRDRIPGPDGRSLGQQTRRDHEAWSVTQIVRVRLESEPEDGDRLPTQLSQVLLELCDHAALDRKSTRLNSSHGSISYAVFCLKKKKKKQHESYSISQIHTECTTV